MATAPQPTTASLPPSRSTRSLEVRRLHILWAQPVGTRSAAVARCVARCVYQRSSAVIVCARSDGGPGAAGEWGYSIRVNESNILGLLFRPNVTTGFKQDVDTSATEDYLASGFLTLQVRRCRPLQPLQSLQLPAEHLEQATYRPRPGCCCCRCWWTSTSSSSGIASSTSGSLSTPHSRSSESGRSAGHSHRQMPTRRTWPSLRCTHRSSCSSPRCR